MIRTAIAAALTVFTIGITLVPASAKAADKPNANQKPNIVLCMADDQGWGDVGFRNHPVLKTPVMDELAATALRFDRFYAAAPVCSPTRGSVMTGRHPNRFGCFSWGHSLRPQEITVAEALKTAGYTTGHFGKWHLGSMRADSPVCPGQSGFDEWMSSPNFFENNPLLSHNGKVVQTQGESSQVTVDAAIDFIRGATKRKQPFLAVVWFGSPHGPHIAIDADRELYKDQPARLQNFYGEITGMDRAVGNLRKELKTLDITDNTLFWYTSDNGALPVGSTGGLSGKKGNLYEGGLRVPAMIEWPDRIKLPRATSINCGTVDIYPTVLEVAGVKVEHQPVLDGQSLVPLIDGKMTKRKKPLGFWVYPARGIPMRSTQMLQQQAREQAAKSKSAGSTKPATPPGTIAKQYSSENLPGNAAWLDGNFKLHRRVSKSGDASDALYDLEKDPQEKTNILEQNAERGKKMQADLEAWQKSVINSLNGNDYPSK